MRDRSNIGRTDHVTAERTDWTFAARLALAGLQIHLQTMHPRIVLASSSRYRKDLLDRLRVPYVTDTPDIDESPLPGEPPAHTAERLSLCKARAVAQRHPGAIVIGSDQVADLDGTPIGKAGSHAAAVAQLVTLRGRTVRFHSGIAVLDGRNGHVQAACVDTEVTFRELDHGAIEAYVAIEQPYDCAGSAKIESLGICLVESVRGDDPTALIGLPLIRLTAMLANIGIALPWQD